MTNQKQIYLENMFIEIVKTEILTPKIKMNDDDFIKLLEQCEKDGSLPY